jgi:hypothetical protein
MITLEERQHRAKIEHKLDTIIELLKKILERS